MSFFCQAVFLGFLFPWFQGLFSHVSIEILRITSEHLALRGYTANLDHKGNQPHYPIRLLPMAP